jgi:hypothetical protein
MYYYGARYYAAWTCRFVSVDPMKEKRNWLTPYNYVQNNPMNRVDPTGTIDIDPQISNTSHKYPSILQDKIDEGVQSAYTIAAKLDISKEQVSFRRMDKIEGHDNKTFNSYHFVRVVNFYMENAKKEKYGTEGEDVDDYKVCSPAMYYAINSLYNWKGDDEIRSGYVVDHISKTGEKIKGIETLVREKNLIGNEKRFVAVDKNGVAGHYSKEVNKAVKMNESVANWAKEQTQKGGVGMFIVSAIDGYHSLILIADRRGKDDTYRLLDQHGNEETGSSSTFDRTVSHTREEIDDFFVRMGMSWGDVHNNYSFNLFELKRD